MYPKIIKMLIAIFKFYINLHLSFWNISLATIEIRKSIFIVSLSVGGGLESAAAFQGLSLTIVASFLTPIFFLRSHSQEQLDDRNHEIFKKSIIEKIKSKLAKNNFDLSIKETFEIKQPILIKKKLKLVQRLHKRQKMQVLIPINVSSHNQINISCSSVFKNPKI